MLSADVKHGIYRHYKGWLYQVFGIAHDANYEDRKVVVYIGLELDEAHLGPRLAVRTLEDFVSWVALDGRVRTGPPDEERLEHLSAWEEGWRPRFEYLGPELTGDMLVT